MKYFKYIFGLFLGVFTLTLFVPSVKAQEFVIAEADMIIPSYDMDNDVWLDGNMISDVYYRYDIIYDGFTYTFFEDINLAYQNNDISEDTLLYIDLNPMYNFIFAKFEDQGNGLFYWTELGSLEPENPSYIRTIIINKNGINFKNDNYNGVWTEWLWDDFNISGNILGWSLIGYENQTSIDYYDYNSGYQDGYRDGRNEGFRQGRDSGIQTGRDLGYDEGYDLAKYEYGFNYNDIVITGDNAYSIGYQKGVEESGDLKTNIINFIPGVLGSIFMFFFQIGQIGILGITILDILGILVLISGLIFIIKFFF